MLPENCSAPLHTCKERARRCIRTRNGKGRHCQCQSWHPIVQVWEAVQEMRETGAWAAGGVPQVAAAFEAQLATGEPHDCPALAVPDQAPGVPDGASPMEVTPSAGAGLVPKRHACTQEAVQGDL